MFLSEETAFTVRDGDGRTLVAPPWRTIRRGVIPRLGLVLAAGSRLLFSATRAVSGPAGLVTFGSEDGSFPETRITIRFRPGDGSGEGDAERELFSETIPHLDPRAPWVERPFCPDFAGAASGSFIVDCVGPPGAELAVYEFVVSPEETLELERARAFRELRLRNEKANFDAYYKHSLFQQSGNGAPPPGVAATPAASSWMRRLRTVLGSKIGRPVSGAPPPSVAATEAPPAPVSAFTLAHNLLVERLEIKPPGFGVRLASRVAARRAGPPGRAEEEGVRVLSLCSGEARIEESLVRSLPAGGARVTLLDMNPDLLAVAQRRLSAYGPVETILEDVNEIRLGDRSFDLILCVSGLHHVVELEHLFDEVASHLAPDGEFWSIGETLGRNGGRMWPDSYEVANGFFRKLPAKYRINRTLGGAAEAELPDLDYSIGCFEGIRCESIERVMETRLAPVIVSRHNCMLWKLFSPTYSDNYDTSDAGDRALIEEAVGLEIDLFRRGGRPIELNGAYALRG